MADLIDRQAAIDDIRTLKPDGLLVDAKWIEMWLKQLPSAQPTYTDEEIQKMQDLEQAEIEKAYQLGYEDGMKDAQPERKKGKWISNDNGTYSCSVCQSWIPEEQHCYARYCLYCGADMRGDEE